MATNSAASWLNVNATNDDSSIKKDIENLAMEDIQGPPTPGTALPPSIPENEEICHRSSASEMSSADSALARRATASECAASVNKFNLAGTRNHFKLEISERSDSLLENMRDRNCPHISDNEFVDMLHTIEDNAVNIYYIQCNTNSADGACCGCKAVQPAHTSDLLDMYSLKEAKLSILHHILRLSRPNRSHGRRREVEFRSVIDDLITLAFCQRHDSKHLYKYEAELFLPAEPFTATADIATFLPLSTLWENALAEEHAYKEHVFHALTCQTGLLTFAVETKAIYGADDEPGRQLTFCLCSAQNQRRALGFTDHIIYGLSFIGHTAQLFTSHWVEDTVFTAPTRHKFNLLLFREHMELYIVLCKLAEHAEKQLEEMESLRNDPFSGIKEKNKEAADKPWRHENKPSTPDSSRGKRRGSGTHRMGMGTGAMDGEVEVSGGMPSDSERDSDSEEDFSEHLNVTSKSFMTSESGNDNETHAPLKTESLEEFTLKTDTLTPTKDIGVWAQHIADEAEC